MRRFLIGLTAVGSLLGNSAMAAQQCPSATDQQAFELTALKTALMSKECPEALLVEAGLLKKPESGGADVFVLISAVERAGLNGLADGQRVSYDEERDPRKGKTSAVNLKAL